MAENNDTQPKPRNILVVTDRPDDVGVLRQKIGNAGYELTQSRDGDEALEMIQKDSADLVLLDIDVPGVEGVKFCRRLRARPETEAIPVIIIGDETEGEATTVLDIGADGFVTRPFRRAELLSRIRTLLRLKALHDRVSEQNRELLQVNTRLDELNQELMARNRELEQGMEMAHRLQEALLPQQYPRVNNIAFSHKYAPAEAVGGDTFQFIGMDDDCAAIFIADVSGHGVRAALVASIVRTVIDYIDVTDKTPANVLEDFNSRFRSVLGPMSPQIYATAVFMILDGAKRTASVASAGHPFPLLVSKERMTAEPLMGPDEGGPAIGFVGNPDYPTMKVDLSAGDIILGFTDGTYEVVSESGEMYGLARMQDLVASNVHLIPRDLIQRIITETDEFMGTARRPDDVCLVAAEIY